MRFLTAGESHGPAEITIVEGMPAGVPLSADCINAQLKRRQAGYGRGDRMRLETDTVQILSGVLEGHTTGAPIALMVSNRDYRQQLAPVTSMRPGHADYAGAIKYSLSDARPILERSSARETVARVLAGAVASALLEAFGIRIASHVLAIGGIWADRAKLPEDFSELYEQVEASPVRCADPQAAACMMKAIDEAKAKGDSLGGVIELVSTRLPVGLGSHVHWDRRLDALLSFSLMSIPAIKGVEIGLGFESANLPGSQVHDAFSEGFVRKTNHAGGIEGGMSNGEPLILRIAMKPIPTMTHPLDGIELTSGEVHQAHVERSDVCAVPACGVVAEAMASWVLASALMEKRGGDSLQEMQSRHE